MRIHQLIVALFISVSIQLMAQQEVPQQEKPLYGSGGNEKSRVRYNVISLEDISVEEEVTVKFLLKVDENGNVVSGRVIGKNTTDDSELIQKILQQCKEQLKYAKRDAVTEEYYTVTILKK